MCYNSRQGGFKMTKKQILRRIRQLKNNKSNPMTYKQIGDIFNVSRATVHAWLKRDAIGPYYYDVVYKHFKRG